jgi:hypothetical protein
MREPLSQRLLTVQRTFVAMRDAATRFHATAAAGALNADNARSLVEQCAWALTITGQIPRTAASAAKASEEWDYQGTLASDFTAVENALNASGNWVATRSNALWTGYARGQTFPWVETVPAFSAAATAGLRTELTALIAAIDTFQGNIPDA